MKNVMIALLGLMLVAGGATAGQILLASHNHDEVLEHGGGLDQCGGHYNRKTGQYHYHRTPRC